jgi:hypothetical protein
MPKTKIIIVGYPKSGNTWITRLVAELIQCPVAGFWKTPPSYTEIAVEGSNRKSEFECYKSHLSYQSLIKDSRQDKLKLIFVVRDPRDIAISGASYFSFEKPLFLMIKKRLSFISPGGRLYKFLLQSLKNLGFNESFYRLNESERLDHMMFGFRCWYPV